jgi:hypothetical protein
LVERAHLSLALASASSDKAVLSNTSNVSSCFLIHFQLSPNEIAALAAIKLKLSHAQLANRHDDRPTVASISFGKVPLSGNLQLVIWEFPGLRRLPNRGPTQLHYKAVAISVDERNAQPS